jgi:hypothetical protein
MTSHVQTLSMLLFQDSTGTSSTLFALSLAIRPDFVCVSPTSIEYTLAFVITELISAHTVDARNVLYMPSSPLPAKQMKVISDHALNSPSF